MTLPFDLDGFVRDYSRQLQLVHSIETVTPISNGVIMQCSTMQYQRSYRERYGTAVEIGKPTGGGEPVTIQVEFCTADIVRFRCVAGSKQSVPDNRTPMVVADFVSADVAVSVIEMADAVVLNSEILNITLRRDPWQFTIRNKAGDEVYATIPARVFQHPPTGESHLDGASITDAWPWFFRDLYPLGFVKDETSGQIQTFETAVLHHDEHFYGFGEKFSTLDKRGQMINLWHANATGNTWPLSYKNVPFFLSSYGYGIFINSTYPIRYHMGDLSHTRYSMHLQHSLLDYFFVYGPDYRDIIARYTSITGKPALPPLWSFGLWMSRMSYRTQAEVETVAQELRSNDIPCDVIHIDTDWFARPWANDLTFSTERFPDPAAMITRLREQGYRLTLWQLPYIATDSHLYAEGIEHGYFATKDDGTPWHLNGFFGPAAVIDFSNPEAVSWYQSKFTPLFDMGVAAIKTDFGEGAPPEARYANADGLSMHNLYPLLYNRAIFEHTKAVTGEGIVWGRSAYAGSQRYPVVWGGDPAALWEDLGNLWHGGLGLGLCGFPFWSVDIGGFGGTPTPELYIRWAQAGLFVSHPRAHGPIAREPWVFGEQAVTIFRRYAKLRYRLIPYLWSSAHRSVETGLPIMRPLLLDWPDDPTTATIDDQWLFGESILVAPIVDQRNHRKVYLPSGQWYEYWTDEILDGGRWLDVQADIETLPLYIRAGAVIPLAPDMAHTGERQWNPLTVEIYPGNVIDATFELVDGSEVVPIRYTKYGAHVKIGATNRTVLLRLHTDAGVQENLVEINGSPQEITFK